MTDERNHLPTTAGHPDFLQHYQVPNGDGRATALPPGATDDDGGGGGLHLGRVLSSFSRFKWLILACAAVGCVGAYFAYQSVQPEYEVEGSLWITTGEDAVLGGPVQQAQLLEPSAWIDLLRTYQVLDPVVVQERLYIEVDDEHRPLFADFELDSRFLPGKFVLEVSEDGRSVTLETADGLTVGSDVAPGQRVGTEAGFVWTPPVQHLEPGMSVPFQIKHPREAARALSAQVQTQMDRTGNFITLRLRGTDRERIASTLDALMERHVQVASELKRAKLDTLTVILNEQLASMESELEGAEGQLERFRVQTITLPTEESAPIASGLEQTQGAVMSEFFGRRMELDRIRRDRERLEEILDSLPQTGVRVESFELVPSVRTSSQLTSLLGELTGKRAELRALEQRFTEEYQPVRDLRAEIRNIEQNALPALTRSLIAELRDSEAEMSSVLAQRASELEEIPPRAIAEAGLDRDVQIASALYTDVRQRYETARLAAASSVSDIRILDEPEVPSVPSSDQRAQMAAMAFLGFLGLGLAGAVLMDRTDPRLRYLAEVSDDMGLEILGAIPALKGGRQDNSHVVFEAFRDLRMRTEFAHGPTRPLVVALTSADTGEGKTFVSANLGIAFSQLGRRTLLIDADTRRGDLHDILDRRRKPGLTDVLQETVDEAVICRTDHDNLHLLTSGSRMATSPELLSSGRMQRLLALLKQRYDVILIDSPPMAAGSDAFILGAHAGNLLLVMRSGETNKELAKSKMETFLRLPVRLLGGVLNDVTPGSGYGSYRYYTSYLPDYEAYEEESELPPEPDQQPALPVG